MGFELFDLQELYKQTFKGRHFNIGEQQSTPDDSPLILQGENPFGKTDKIMSSSGKSLIQTNYRDKEIWLPVQFTGLNVGEFGASDIMLPYSVIKISGKKTIIKTPLENRKGAVKELFNTGDYSIGIKGFVIDDEKRAWPEKELNILKRLFELNESFQLENGLTNIFLEKDNRVVIQSLEFPEVEGGRKHIRPFNMTLESDSVFILEEEK